MAPGTQQQKPTKSITQSRTYKDVVSFLDSIKPIEYHKNSLQRMKQLDKLCGNPSQAMDIVLVAGSNGKSSTINFASKLLKEEGYVVGAAHASHILNYNERIVVGLETIQNKNFTEVVSEVIDIAQANKIDATAHEINTAAALLFFKSQKVKVALLEVGIGGKNDATNIFNPKVVAITRIAQDQTEILGDDLDVVTEHMLEVAKQGCWMISAEQSKIRLQKMKTWAEKHDVSWAMPIRKLAPLPYMYEQLYGRTASLAERIAQLYVEHVCQKFSPFLRGNLLSTQRGQRGRPTLEAKRNAELNPIKTLKKFWVEEFELLPGRFSLFDKEKPSILLDNGNNIDAFENVFLGIRLLHYQHPLKDFTLIMGVSTDTDILEAAKLVRYLLKKVGGQAFFVNLTGKLACHKPQELADLAKELGVKAQAYETFDKAFESARQLVDERDGLVAVTGSPELVAQYWHHRGIKKVG